MRHTHWSPVSVATLSYGYGVSVTPMQLAQAYAVVAAGGMHRPISFVREEHPPRAERVLSEHSMQQLTAMLEAVVSAEGTGVRAAVPGYRVAGKTGTARKSQAGGYSDNRYVAVFAGFAPATRPRVAIVVVIDEPSAGIYYGGDVAAPVFSAVMAGALRVLAVAPDTTLTPPLLLAHAPLEGGRAVRAPGDGIAQHGDDSSIRSLRASRPRRYRVARSPGSAQTVAASTRVISFSPARDVMCTACATQRRPCVSALLPWPGSPCRGSGRRNSRSLRLPYRSSRASWARSRIATTASPRLR